SPLAATLDGRVLTNLCEVAPPHSTARGVYAWDLDAGTPARLGTFDIDFGPGDVLHPLPDGRRAPVWKWWGEHWVAMWDLVEARELWRQELDFANSAIAVNTDG